VHTKAKEKRGATAGEGGWLSGGKVGGGKWMEKGRQVAKVGRCWGSLSALLTWSVVYAEEGCRNGERGGENG